MGQNYNRSLISVGRRLTLLCGAVSAIAMVAAGAADGPSTTLVSRAYDGGPALTAAESLRPVVSASGGHVAFISNALDFTPDGNGQYQVFVRDLKSAAMDLVSRSSSGTPGNSRCEAVAISPDGRFAAFSSFATNLVPGDGNSALDVFLHDRQGGITERVSVASGGSEAQGDSGRAISVSADGRFVCFNSDADNLVPGDSNGASDVFLRDRVLGTTECVSVRSDRSFANGPSGWGLAMTPDGRFIAFDTGASDVIPGDTNACWDVYLRDRAVGRTTRVSVTDSGGESNGSSESPTLSASGRLLAFESRATNMRPGSSGDHIWVRDRTTQRTEMVSVSSDEQPGNQQHIRPAISADGRFVVFLTNSNNLAGDDAIYDEDFVLRDRFLGRTELVTTPGELSTVESRWWGYGKSSLSGNGALVAFEWRDPGLVEGDANGRGDVFIRDRTSAATRRASLTTEGIEGVAGAKSTHGVVSADGRFTSFVSDATNLVPGDTNGVPDVFVYDRVGDSLERVSISSSGQQAAEPSVHARPALSLDGRFVAFVGSSPGLEPDASYNAVGVFVRDRKLGTTQRVSLTNAGERLFCSRGGNAPTISADGRFVAFIAGGKVFVRDRGTSTTERVDVSSAEEPANFGMPAYGPASISANGRFVAFVSWANNLVPGDVNELPDVFLRDRVAGTTERISVQTELGYTSGPSVSADGRFVAYVSAARDRFDQPSTVYLFDRSTHSVRAVGLSPPGHTDMWPTITPDGRYISFTGIARRRTPAASWGPFTTDAFLWDRDLGLLEQTSLGADGQVSNEPGDPYVGTVGGGISPDARFVVFHTTSGDLATGDSNGSSDVFLRDQAGALPAAPALTTRPISPTEIRLTWRDLSTNERGFVVERRAGPTPGSGIFGKIATLDRNVTAYTSGGLQPGSAYTYRVRAFNWRGDSPNSNEASAVTLPPPPSAPISLAAQALSSTEIKLTWRDTSGTETGFKIERKSGTSGFFAQIGTVGANATTFTSTGLFPRSTYTYRVRAHNGTTNSAYSSVVEGTTNAR